jgi:hypothetical protein
MMGSGRFGDFHQKIVNPEFIGMSLEKEFNQRKWVHWIAAPDAPCLFDPILVPIKLALGFYTICTRILILS